MCRAEKPYHLHVPIVLKSGNIILLETSGPGQACNWIALPYIMECEGDSEGGETDWCLSAIRKENPLDIRVSVHR